MKIFRKGFNFAQDGPGNRLVYHVAGCNMHCLWCSNPEGMGQNGGEDYSPDRLVTEAVSCKPMFFSGGGVTFTGGEATLGFEELLSALKGLRENGIHTALETNGTSPHLAELSEYIDYLIMDFKHYDGEVLKKYTGTTEAQFERIKKNFGEMCETRGQYHVRIPLIKHFNAEDPEPFAEFFAQFPTEHTVFEFLKYHEYGKKKWTEEYKIKDGFVDAETVGIFRKAFENRGLRCVET